MNPQRPSVDRSGFHYPRWLPYTAWGAFLVTIPSAVWRVLMICGLLPATADLRAYELAGNPTLGYAYVFGLSIVQLLTGFLTVGLVKPWGERLFGIRVPLIPVLILAILGGLAVTWLFTWSLPTALLAGKRPDNGLVTGPAFWLMLACYSVIPLWGPLELASAVGYGMRRTRR